MPRQEDKKINLYQRITQPLVSDGAYLCLIMQAGGVTGNDTGRDVVGSSLIQESTTI